MLRGRRQERERMGRERVSQGLGDCQYNGKAVTIIILVKFL